jgi:hypothetical protein
MSGAESSGAEVIFLIRAEPSGAELYQKIEMILRIDVKYSVPQQYYTMTTTNTATAHHRKEEIQPLPRLPVGGANELKRRIQDYVTLVGEMKNDFERSVHSPKAQVNPTPICIPIHEYHSSQCAVRHRDFIRKITRESPDLSIPESNVNCALAALENFRKMLVTNKQQRKTAHKDNHRVSTAIQASLQTTMGELEPPMNAFSVDLLKMDDATKQHHRTMSRNILEEVNRLLMQLRTQFIVALQAALEDSVGKIIQHAEECREFIERTRQLALLEFCATRWFNAAQTDAMDNDKEYFVGIHEIDGGGRVLKVHTFQDREEILVATFDVDEEFVKQVLTDDSITEFAWAEQTLASDKQGARERYANYEREQLQFYADQARAAAAWNERFDIADGRTAACAIEMMEEIDNDSDYDPDTYWG